MARKKASPAGQRLLDLKKAHPDATVSELAEKLGISTNSVYQAETRLREQGHLPALRRARYGARKRTPTPSASPPAQTLGRGKMRPVTVEDHLKADIGENKDAIKRLEAQLEEVGSELQLRRSRHERLERAQAALVQGSPAMEQRAEALEAHDNGPLESLAPVAAAVGA